MGDCGPGQCSATERAAHPVQIDVTARHQQEGGQIRGHSDKGAIRPVLEPTASAWWEQSHSGQEVASMPSSVVAMIRTRGLTKDFARGDRTVHAVRGLDLDIAPGELVAVLGPNGAGKSTT